MNLNRKQLGQYAEDLAAFILEEQGHKILQRNFRCRRGEIDLISQKQNTLIFTEVRSRSNQQNAKSALASIRRKKQERLLHTAQYYLYKHGSDDTEFRFDLFGFCFFPDGSLEYERLLGGFTA